MKSNTPWSNAETLRRLDRQEIGQDLSTLVAEKLRNDDGNRGLWNSHRDYCGHGLIYQNSQYQLVGLSDSCASEGTVIIAFHSTSDFVTWLAHQSDYSLSGADESVQALHSNDPSIVNNQRITRARLRDYVHDCTPSLVPFRNFLFALDLEFRFLVLEFGFSKVRPRMTGRACVVRYRMPHALKIDIVSELQPAPLTKITIRGDSEIGPADDEPLVVIAEARCAKGPVSDNASCPKSEAEFRRYFRQYAEPIRQRLTEFLPQNLNGSLAPNSPRLAEPPSEPDTRKFKNPTGKSRLSGSVITAVGFLLLVLELRYLKSAGSPTATGSLRGNAGILFVLSLPCILLGAGVLQALVGANFRDLKDMFSAQTVGRRIGIGLCTIGSVFGAILLAANLS